MRLRRTQGEGAINQRILSAFAVLLTAVYPLAIWFGRVRVEPRWLAGLLLLAAVVRLPSLGISRSARLFVAGALALATAAVYANALLPLKLYPVVVNAALLTAFGYSLAVPPSIFERIARLRQPRFPASAIRYTRRLTQAWCVFFAANGLIALGTALWASDAIWSLYNGVIAYLLMGLMVGGEYVLRMRRVADA